MLAAMSRRVSVFLFVLAAACGPKGARGPGAGAPGEYPALGFVAADAAYVVTATRVGDAVAGLPPDEAAELRALLADALASDPYLAGLARELGAAEVGGSE